MESSMEKICPFCKQEIKEENHVRICSSCGTAHHEKCWEEHKGCSTEGCPEQYHEDASVVVCENCGMKLEDSQLFCPACGTPKMIEKNTVCANCGAEVKEGQAFCPTCGHKIEHNYAKANGVSRPYAVNISTPYNPYSVGAKTPKRKKKWPIIVGVIATTAMLLIALLVIVLSMYKESIQKKGPDFSQLYEDHCSSLWAEVGADGSYLFLDTNPYDIDGMGALYRQAAEAMEQINKELGLPDSLYKEMITTVRADGKQSETFEEQGVTVSWTYHPDKGLEVTYKKINNKKTDNNKFPAA